MNNNLAPINCRKVYQMQQNELSRIVSLVNKKHDKYDRVSAVSRTKKRAEVFRHGRVIFIGNFEMTMDFLKDMMN